MPRVAIPNKPERARRTFEAGRSGHRVGNDCQEGCPLSARRFPQLIVGIDRSLGGRAALRVAAAEAIRRGVPLHCVRVRSFLLGPVDDFTLIDAAFDETFGGIPEGLDIRRAVIDAPVAKGLTDRAHNPGIYSSSGHAGSDRQRGGTGSGPAPPSRAVCAKPAAPCWSCPPTVPAKRGTLGNR